MPDYTSLGISFPLPGDRIKDAALEAKLAEDIKQTAITANQAILSEGVRAEGAATASAALDATSKANQAKVSAVASARAYTDQVIDTSHLASDTDGTPYYSPGSMTLRVFTDTDGNPFFLDA